MNWSASFLDRRLHLKTGHLLSAQYRVLDGPISGGNGNCYLCEDLTSHRTVIIKSFSSTSSCHSDGERESKLVQIANQLDPSGEYFVQYISSFSYKRHFCLVLERYGKSLFEAQRERHFSPVPVPAISSIIYRVTKAVDLLYKHRMIHTDIKLENILLAPDFVTFERIPINVKLIDLGSIASVGKWHNHLATTRYYRAPEIILGLKWSHECDVWSLGCLLVELFLGRIPFMAKDPLQHLFLVQHMIGRFPEWMLEGATDERVRGTFKGGLIDPGMVEKVTEYGEVMEELPPLIELIKGEGGLADLALKMLEPDPFLRISIEEILGHSFLSDWQTMEN